MTQTEKMLNWDIRALYSPKILKEWLEVITKHAYVRAELFENKQDTRLYFFIASSEEELEKRNNYTEFSFSKNYLEKEFWGFVGITAMSNVDFCDYLNMY